MSKSLADDFLCACVAAPPPRALSKQFNGAIGIIFWFLRGVTE